ncbi:MAG TPA: response regulator [Polyangia bacterium]|nr:response regulator [Polyangia bacterium]
MLHSEQPVQGRSLILLIEDDQDIRASTAELLVDEGFSVVEAADGSAALARLRRGLAPSLILLDLMMPGLTGWGFRREQLADPSLRDIPVLVITASGMSDNVLKQDLGDVGLVRKPFAAQALLTEIRAQLPSRTS